MPDETTEQVIEPNVAETQETTIETTPTLEELTKQVAELTKSNETQKNEIAGLNRANTESATKYNNLVKQHETEAERKTREAEENKIAEQERLDGLTTREASLIEKENALLVKEKAVELGFNAEDRLKLAKMGINTVAGVELYKADRDLIKEQANTETAKNILDSHSGKPEGYNNQNNNVDTSFLDGCKA